MFSLLIALVITVVEVALFAYACVMALALLIRAYIAFKESKFYKKCMLMKRIWNGDIELGVVEVKPNGNMTYHPKGKIDRSDTPKTINDQLDKAKAKNSTIDGEEAGVWTPNEETKNDILRKSGR